MNVEIETLQSFRRALSDIQHLTRDMCVILIMGRRETTVMRGEYEGFSLAASLYEGFEVDEIINAYRSFGVYVQYFEDELDFIAWHNGGGYDAVPRRHKLVYTFAINGTGPGRRSFVPAYCAREGIPTVNSDAYTCAIGRHKFHCNRLLNAFNLPVPQSWSYDARTHWFKNESPALGTEVIGKATYEDGSIGLTQATVGPFTSQLESAFAQLSETLRQPLTVQEFISGDEIAVPVIKLDRYYAPDPVVILTAKGKHLAHEVLSYDVKWVDDYRFAPSSVLAPDVADAARVAAVGVATVLGHRGFARIDFRVADDGRPLVIDTAAHPHLTRTSSYAYLFNQMDFSYEEMMLLLLATGAKEIGLF